MAVIICIKFVLPTEISYNKAAKGGVWSLIINTLCYKGDRWFVYTLYIIFLLLIPIRKWLKNKWVWLGLMFVLTVVLICFLDYLPTVFALKQVFHYMVFFIAGFALNEYYPNIKLWTLKYWWFVYAVFILANIVFIKTLCLVPFIIRFVLPFTGTLAVMTMAFQLEKVVEKSKVAQYIEYCGKYSLQFYLFNFSYPIIRIVIVSVLHVINPFVILASVFVLQLIATTIIVEITRRIKWLKISCGY